MEGLDEPLKFQTDQIEELFKILELGGQEGEEIEPVELPFKDLRGNFKKGWKDIQAFGQKQGIEINKDTAKLAFTAMKDEGLITLQESFGESKEAFRKEFKEKIEELIKNSGKKTANKNTLRDAFKDDKLLDVIWSYFKDKGVQLNESHLFNRWGVLAGIIKG